MAGFGPEGDGSMSYILDALKKLEHEKSRKSLANGMNNISGALFEHERPRPSGTAGWKIVLAVVAAVLVTFAATWQFLQPAKRREKVVAGLTPPVSPPPITIEAAPPPLPSPPVIPVQEAPLPAAPLPTPVVPARASAPPSKPQKAAVQVAPASVADDAALLTMQELHKRVKGPAAPAAQTMAAPADIKLSGIAWQEERRARRAVVNGFLMQEGGVVSGARITDIYQERVRFSLSGKTFEIPLVSSGASAAGK
jgi:general secretion pathway protein B